ELARVDVHDRDLRYAQEWIIGILMGWGGFAQQIVKVHGVADHGERTIGIAWPLVAGAIPVELQAVAVGVAEVEGFADAVVGGAVERDAGADETAKRIGQG